VNEGTDRRFLYKSVSDSNNNSRLNNGVNRKRYRVAYPACKCEIAINCLIFVHTASNSIAEIDVKSMFDSRISELGVIV
jgi:hypothetical protein